MRLIDRDELLKSAHYIETEDLNGYSILYPHDVLDAPAIDAVEVVRCRECECACLIDSINMSYHCTHPQWCTSPYGVSGDDYCSYGERRNDD